jgi:uncharacterized protein with FMN-binding domain
MGRAILATVGTATCLVILLSLKTRSTPGLPPAPAPAIAPATQNAPSHSPGPAASKPRHGTSSTGGPANPGTTTTTTVAGAVTQTIYGPIQVTITVKGGKITAASVPVYPNGTMHDQQINSYAIPQLIQETIAADSANISAVSGASYTSQGYISSLQSAIDKAGA